jgi:hypothetical protein
VLLTRALAEELDASVSVDFRPTGLVCIIDARLPVEDEPRPARHEFNPTSPKDYFTR